jgi:undecaprenyl-diphosphatase
MIEWLKAIDSSIVLAVNGTHNHFLDSLFWLFSGKLTWIPLYLLLFFFVWKYFGFRKMILFLVIVGVTIALVDFTSVVLFKDTFQRYRPSHHLVLSKQLYFHVAANGDVYKGGQYGFVSSHAANFFSLTVLAGMTLRAYRKNLIWLLLIIACMVSLSRVYLGVHYPSDVIVGGLWGATISYLSFRYLLKPLLLTKK